jgi:hypothetical protein
MMAQDPQMTARYVPNRVITMPDIVVDKLATREYGIMLQGTLSCI